MKAEQTCFYEWQKQYSSKRNCLEHLHDLRWPNGFVCLYCGHGYGYQTGIEWRYECQQCHRQTSVTAGSLFHATKLALTNMKAVTSVNKSTVLEFAHQGQSNSMYRWP